jgi:hypothetical protein
VPGQVVAEPIPKKPDPGQKRPPCDGPDQRAINGACYVPVPSQSPPCEGLFEHDGICYAPLQATTRRQPTSEEP